MPTLEELQARKQKALDRGVEYIEHSLGSISESDRIAIIATIETLYAEWGNLYIEQASLRITEQLEKAGIEVRRQTFTGDSSYPTEYTIRKGQIFGLGPTFEMALIDFVTKLVSSQDRTVTMQWGGQD